MEEIGITVATEKVEETADVKGPVVGGFTIVSEESARDDYNTYKRLLQNLEYLRVQEDYIKDELHNLKKEYRHAQEEVIMATNRADTLDPALLRPGRLDRKIEFPLPDRRQKRLIFSTITGRMNLSDDLDLEDYVARPDRISGADINAICQEAGMHAVRENRYIVLAKDFEKAYKNNVKKDESDHEFYK
ncbi:hypothetical protein OTU49_010609 [Cherax quadricarinatus]|uniref:26S protease regulatory subunit 6B n=1 Tax=Cherax quadricarinatus TaxID=27406 RepID=A0AAW0W7L4_CHEQU